MSKVTSKRQVTIPKELADRYRIEAGDEIRWIPAGSEIRVLPAGTRPSNRLDAAERLDLFDRATRRRDRRTAETGRGADHSESKTSEADRGWTRAELHERGRTR
jgi:AbrB family looped-hinge helix DNA binding protein